MERFENVVRERVAREDGHHADYAVADDERVSGKRDHSLADRPILIADLWVADHRIRDAAHDFVQTTILMIVRAQASVPLARSAGF